jgi:hypothetical protein
MTLSKLVNVAAATARKTTQTEAQNPEKVNPLPVHSESLFLARQQQELPKRGRNFVATDNVEVHSPSQVAIIEAANTILRRTDRGSSLVFERRFRAHFGVSSFVASQCWELLVQQEHQDLTELHSIDRYLWALMLLMNYDTEEVNCTKASGVDEQTFRRWAWDFVERVAELESVVESSSLSLFCHVLAALHLLTLCNLCTSDCLGEPKKQRRRQ